MTRIYEELPCGCLVSEDGGGGYSPCSVGYLEFFIGEEKPTREEIDLHNKVNKMYFGLRMGVKQIWNELVTKPHLEQKIDELIEAILEMDFDIERDGYVDCGVIGFQGKNGLENAKATIREILEENKL